MAEAIVNYFSAILNPKTSDEARYQLSKEHIELCQNPETIFILFQIITNSPNNTIRQQSIISIRRCLRNCWIQNYQNQESGELIKNSILEILPKEPEMLLAKNLIETSEVIFETDANNWPNLFNFIQSNIQNPRNLLISMYLITILARYLGTEVIEQNLEIFNQIASIGFGSQDPEIIASTCEMFGVIISFVSEKRVAICESHFQFMLQIYPNFLVNNNNFVLLKQVTLALADSFQCDVLPMPAIDVLNIIFQILQNPQVSKDVYPFIFTAIQHLIKNHPSEISEASELVLKSIIIASAATFNDSFYCDNQDMTHIASTAGDLAKLNEDPLFIKHLLQLSSVAVNDATLLAYSLVFFNSLDECKDEAANDIKPIVEATLLFLNSPNPYVKEVAAMITNVIGDILEPSQLDLANILTLQLLPYIVSGIENLVKPALESLISIFNQGLVKSDNIPNILDVLIAVLNNNALNTVHHICIEAISSLVFASEEDFSPYVEKVYPLILHAASFPPINSYIVLKQQAIIALGMIHRFGVQEFSPEMQKQTLDLILSSVDSNNLDIEMNHSVIVALGNLIIAHSPILIYYKQQIYEIINNHVIHIMNQVLNHDEGNAEKEEEIFDYSISGFRDTFSIIKWIFKEYNELLVEEAPSQWMATILHIMSAPLEDLQIPTIVAGMYGTAMIKVHSDLYLNQLIKLFDSEYPTVVGKCFKAFCLLIKKQVPINPEFIKVALTSAFAAIDEKLNFYQQKECFDWHSSKHLYKFFSILLKVDKNSFPLQQFIQAGKKLLNEKKPLYELSQYISVLSQIYYASEGNLQSLSKKIANTTMLKAFERYISTFSGEEEEYSAFSVPPAPLAAMCTLLKYEPNQITPIIPKILEIVHLILSAEYSGERFYNSSITNAIMFVCEILRLNPSNFDFQNWFPLILNKLPLQLMGDEKLSEKIYPIILSTIQDNNIVKEFGSEFLRLLANTLGIKSRQFKRYRFSQQTYNTIISTTGQLMGVSGNTSESMKQFFTNEQSYQRFCSRMNPTQP